MRVSDDDLPFKEPLHHLLPNPRKVNSREEWRVVMDVVLESWAPSEPIRSAAEEVLLVLGSIRLHKAAAELRDASGTTLAEKLAVSLRTGHTRLALAALEILSLGAPFEAHTAASVTDATSFLLGDDAWVVRYYAVQILADVASSAVVLDALRSAEWDENPLVRREAARSLGRHN
jgi:HEAT repeat protein